MKTYLPGIEIPSETLSRIWNTFISKHLSVSGPLKGQFEMGIIKFTGMGTIHGQFKAKPQKINTASSIQITKMEFQAMFNSFYKRISHLEYSDDLSEEEA